MVDKNVNTLEGGNYKCGVHNFETADTEAWHKHCEDPANEHVEDVEGKCIFCGNNTTAYGLPFKRTGTPKGVVCDNCKVSVLGADPAKIAEANAKNAPPKINFETGEPISTTPTSLPETASDNSFSSKKRGGNG